MLLYHKSFPKPYFFPWVLPNYPGVFTTQNKEISAQCNRSQDGAEIKILDSSTSYYQSTRKSFTISPIQFLFISF